uniref:Uncharacterized protein n=1 Tax=Octopus bimaculoides TaxID=37653 RepID=A0A0L8HNN1_OCTBM
MPFSRIHSFNPNIDNGEFVLVLKFSKLNYSIKEFSLVPSLTHISSLSFSHAQADL